jgi:hypothetical protein
MTTPMLPRLGAACGILFPVVLFAAAGSHAYPIGLAAIVAFVPFLAYLCSLARAAEGPDGWLAATAFGAGLAGITLKLLSVAPEVAIHRESIAKGTALHAGLQGIADAATDVCLYPLALTVAAVAVVAVRTGFLPRWLGVGAGVTAVALVVNASYNLVHATGFVPALLLFLLWTLLAAVVLLRRTFAPVGRALSTATG